MKALGVMVISEVMSNESLNCTATVKSALLRAIYIHTPDVVALFSYSYLHEY